MHVGYRSFGVLLVYVEDVRCTAVRVELSVHWEIEISDGAVMTKDFAQVILIDVLGQLLDDNLGATS